MKGGAKEFDSGKDVGLRDGVRGDAVTESVEEDEGLFAAGEFFITAQFFEDEVGGDVGGEFEGELEVFEEG